MGFWFWVLQTAYLALPVAVANMIPPLFKRVNFLAYPIDFGKKWKGKPLLGKNKTFRGFFFGIIGAILIVGVQTWLYGYESFKAVSLAPYGEINFLLLGFLMGFGALFGDALESLFKRQTGRKPGEAWIPWDQFDLLAGALSFVCIVYVPPWQVIVIALVATPALHITINHVAYYLGWQKNKF